MGEREHNGFKIFFEAYIYNLNATNNRQLINVANWFVRFTCAKKSLCSNYRLEV